MPRSVIRVVFDANVVAVLKLRAYGGRRRAGYAR